MKKRKKIFFATDDAVKRVEQMALKQKCLKRYIGILQMSQRKTGIQSIPMRF